MIIAAAVLLEGPIPAGVFVFDPLPHGLHGRGACIGCEGCGGHRGAFDAAPGLVVSEGVVAELVPQEPLLPPEPPVVPVAGFMVIF